MIRDRRFLRYYEQELRFVRDLAGEFASEHARIANRFGLDADACADPHVEWLLDGFAFLAARVQHKLDGDYAVFTQHLLEMVYPDYLAPTPAAGIVAFRLAPDAPAAEQGFTVPRGTALRSRVVPGEATRCVFTTAHPVTLWPVEIAEARYLGGSALAARHWQHQGVGARAALELRLRARSGVPFKALALDRLALHLASHDRIAHLLYETLVGHALALVGRPAGDAPGTVRLGSGRERVRRLGFADDEALFPHSPRGFSGFRLLREYFTLPERFLFVELSGLSPLVRRTAGAEIELAVLLDRFEPELEGAIAESQLEPYATPAINLFRRRAKPIAIDSREEHHHVVIDRARPLDHEVYAVTSVAGFGEEAPEGRSFAPFYAAGARGRPDGHYAIERRPRLLGEREARARVPRSAYLGSEVFIELCDVSGAGPPTGGLDRLDVEALVTNRDLPLRLPLPPGEPHLMPEAGGPIQGARVLGRLGRPRSSPAAVEPEGGGIWGEVGWRLVGHLALNYHSLVDGPDGRGADALRALLELYAAEAEPQVRRHVEGVRGVTARTVTGRLPGGGPIAFGRGLEVTVELLEAAFQEGGSAFLLGGVLEALFRRHVAINGFTETAVRTAERGEIARWPSHPGARHLI